MSTTITTPSGLRDLQGKIEAKRTRMAELFSKRTADGRYDITPEQGEEIKSLNDELTDLGKQYDRERELSDIADRNRRAIDEAKSAPVYNPAPFSGFDGATLNGGNGGDPLGTRAKTLGDLYVESAAYKSFVETKAAGPAFTYEYFDVGAILDAAKTTMTTAAGFAPPNPRTARVVDYAVRRPVVSDLIPSDPTTLSSIKYMEETTFTNNAAPVAENAAKPESALAFTERTVPVEVIATILPVTEQQMEDVPGISGTINRRLTTFVLLAEETQLLTGNGSTPNLQGFLTKSGVQTQVVGSDPVPSAIYKAMTLVRHTGFAEPSAVVAHPNDWQDIRLLQDLNGNYIWGSPSEPGPERIWGLPIVVTTAETENTILLGDFANYSHISRRMGITIRTGYINDDFGKNRLTLRAETRLSLEIYRGSAFAKVTGA